MLLPLPQATSIQAFGYTAISPYKFVSFKQNCSYLTYICNVKNNFVGKWRGMALSGPRLKKRDAMAKSTQASD